MQRYFSALLAVTLLIIAGCGSKSSPTNSTPSKPIRVVVMADTLVAPSLSDPNDAIWSSVAPTGIANSGGNGPFAALTSLADSAFVQGIRHNDTLYLRLKWRDSSHDDWRDAFYVHDTVLHCSSTDTTVHCPNFVRDTDSFKEDEMIVLFKGLPNSAWDALVWRALTTGAAYLAMGAKYVRDTTADSLHKPFDSLIEDAGTLDVAYPNTDYFGNPLFMHVDSCRFHGAVLYLQDPSTVTWSIFSRGWAINQRLPGWYIDTSVVHKDVATRGSRWDTQVIDVWDTTSQTYTVVLEHPMHTGFTDDLDLTASDSVETQLGFFDNQLDLNLGSGSRGFSKTFWLILK